MNTQNQTNTNEHSMKTHHIKPQSKTRQRLLSLALGLMLLGSAGAARAEDMLVNTFDTDISGIAWAKPENLCPGPRLHLGCVPGRRRKRQQRIHVHDAGLAAVRRSHLEHWLARCADCLWHCPLHHQDYLTVEVSIKIDVTNSSLAVGGTSYGVSGIYLNGGDAGWKQIVGITS